MDYGTLLTVYPSITIHFNGELPHPLIASDPKRLGDAQSLPFRCYSAHKELAGRAEPCISSPACGPVRDTCSMGAAALAVLSVPLPVPLSGTG